MAYVRRYQLKSSLAPCQRRPATTAPARDAPRGRGRAGANRYIRRKVKPTNVAGTRSRRIPGGRLTVAGTNSRRRLPSASITVASDATARLSRKAKPEIRLKKNAITFRRRYPRDSWRSQRTVREEATMSKAAEATQISEI